MDFRSACGVAESEAAQSTLCFLWDRDLGHFGDWDDRN
ncbi:uncharacterized protein CLUP02_12914 [Colletotrichum lupini]|uniref:Uncharacterized protein n=1 Tax=Colletotrichum lupini TaxID=145971 RepID=A0A9Q8T1E0_9PEZI|nr:uncharacterized protein CLUP02_12914 [Colletotrichum lupini]UQC87409.1 hypothetical protein CLUP02_12914 [Colletotrichum lupini]